MTPQEFIKTFEGNTLVGKYKNIDGLFPDCNSLMEEGFITLLFHIEENGPYGSLTLPISQLGEVEIH